MTFIHLRSIINRSCVKFRKGLRQASSEDGTLMIEASFVLPIILYSTIAIVLFGMYMYLMVITTHAAALASDRGAVVWDNSYKDPKTGQYPELKRDPLYWRLLQDKMLDRVFGGGGADGTSYTISLPASSHGGSLPEKKMALGAQFLPHAYLGEVSFGSAFVERTLTAAVKRSVFDNSFEKLTGQRIKLEGASISAIVEPVEFIRTVEFARYMTTKIQAMNHLGASPKRAGQVVSDAAKP